MDQTSKQQVAEKLRDANNVLITISKNPSVDEMSAAIGLNLMLNKLGKHSTTVFSGSVPDAISFLEPNKTFENNVDSLRDFIISLDKDKADKLRYKVEDDVVKIYITPYKTKITDKDLEFGQGDFNVDAVIGLGVKKKDDLDKAIVSHGRILHDASIITVNAGEASGTLGEVNWTDENASSLSEMLVSISEALEGGILNDEMSTAFLTGIVSVTDRFSNEKTTPKLMTMAAQLMASGANQQLIANNLNMKSPAKSKKDSGKIHNQNETTIEHNEVLKSSPKKKALDLDKLEKQLQDDRAEQKAKNAKQDEPILPKKTIQTDEVDVKDVPLDKVEKQVKTLEQKQAPKPPVEASAPENHSVEKQEEDVNELIGRAKGNSPKTAFTENPTLGGTFNATSEDAHDRTEADKQKGINDKVLSHKVSPVSEQNKEDPDHVDHARAAVEAAMNDMAFDPANNPVDSLGAQPMPGENVQPVANNNPAPVVPQVQAIPAPASPNPGFAPAPPQQNPAPAPMAPPPGPPPMPMSPPPAPNIPAPSVQIPAPAPQPQAPVQPLPPPAQTQTPAANSGLAPPPAPNGTFPLPPQNNGQLPPPPPQ